MGQVGHPLSGTNFFFSCKRFITFSEEVYEKLHGSPRVAQAVG